MYIPLPRLPSWVGAWLCPAYFHVCAIASASQITTELLFYLYVFYMELKPVIQLKSVGLMETNLVSDKISHVVLRVYSHTSLYIHVYIYISIYIVHILWFYFVLVLHGLHVDIININCCPVDFLPITNHCVEGSHCCTVKCCVCIVIIF